MTDVPPAPDQTPDPPPTAREQRSRRPGVPGGDRLAQTGAMASLGWRTLVAAVRPPFSYGHELVAQINFAVRVGFLPMTITAFALSFGPAGVQASGLLKVFGALDRLGGIFGVLVIREFGPTVCAIVIAGAAGTAMCADLGARKIREELDALVVLGVDPVKSLVVPRFLALIIVTTLFNIYALLFGTLGGIVVAITNGLPLSLFFHTFFANASTTEFAASFLKAGLFGGAIAVICCYKGLHASGGAEGVGRAVNQAVVASFLAFGAINYVFTQILLATHPDLLVPR
jgi:phospholipid/cholesterol/gamma-HCH transport system permease protein